MPIQNKINSWIPAVWPAPDWIKAGTTTRLGGVSDPPFDSFNLATHVGDNSLSVEQNRQFLPQKLNLPSPPLWLNQTHSNHVISANEHSQKEADGIYTSEIGVVCAILTADCVPLLLCTSGGSKIAAIHIGWHGLCSGIIDNAIKSLDDGPTDLFAWIGPHICSRHYEVGDEVREACLIRLPTAKHAFTKNQNGRWQASLEKLVRVGLEKYGLNNINSCGHCTYGEPELFYSYRRQQQTGRTATLIWIDKREN